ncbi:MAG: PhnD/SsuA/transferrin family substrate-binding protein, partial [Ilumatobacter sp.]|nr:PhnD/SsuA/transferrin family substrate-binding protein [Ilumatobacter sp.]
SSHLESVRALARGDGDLASIDSWSLAFIADESPELLDGLHRVGTGPLVPTPAITARHSVDERQLAALRSAFHDALADPALERALTALHIRGSAPLVLDDYRALLPRFNRA